MSGGDANRAARRSRPGFTWPLLLASWVAVAWIALGSPTNAGTTAAEIECLARTIYFEARGEPPAGKLAVAHVVMNRAADPRFPEDICEVVRQGGERPLFGCQFTWWCDGLSDEPTNLRVWRKVEILAYLIYWGRTKDPTGGALWYHADYVEPSWIALLQLGPKIGAHVFYHSAEPATGVASLRDGRPINFPVAQLKQQLDDWPGLLPHAQPGSAEELIAEK